jgi:hypothetical protein
LLADAEFDVELREALPELPELFELLEPPELLLEFEEVLPEELCPLELVPLPPEPLPLLLLLLLPEPELPLEPEPLLEFELDLLSLPSLANSGVADMPSDSKATTQIKDFLNFNMMFPLKVNY